MKDAIRPQSVAVAIMCKTPAPGHSKTRLSPPLRPEECAQLSACFIRDLAETIATLAGGGDMDTRGVVQTGAAVHIGGSEHTGATVQAYAVYTPIGSEADLRTLLPASFRLAPQCEGGFGVRLETAIRTLLAAGHDAAILINSDSPTLPLSILQLAVAAVRLGDNVTLSPAADGGYTLIGLSRPQPGLFRDIPWSTPEVFRLTLARAAEIGLAVRAVPGWYDVDDAASLQMLEDELTGRPPAVSPPPINGAGAPATRAFLQDRNRRRSEPGIAPESGA